LPVKLAWGEQWKAWDGAVLMGVQKDEHVRLQTYDVNWKILRDDNVKGLIVEHIISGFIEKMQKLLYRSKNY
jgi:hypothetical protein